MSSLPPPGSPPLPPRATNRRPADTMPPPHPRGALPPQPPAAVARRWFWPAALCLAVAAGVGAYRLAAPERVAPTAATSATGPAVTELIVEPVPADGSPAAVDAAVPTDTAPTTDPQPGATTTTCASDLGWQLTYPADWYTVDCVLFAPWPIQNGNPAETDAPVFMLELPGTWDEVIVVATPDDREVTDLLETTIAGRRALVVASRQTEPGWYDVGTLVYEIYLDDGERVVVCSTAGTADDLGPLAAVVDGLAASFTT